jgi:hypothetical protein
MDNLDQDWRIAIEHHQAGRLPEAATLYGSILARAPGHAGALHLSGVIAHQQGRFAEAIAEIGRAIQIDGRQAAFHSNLGEAYRALGDLDAAVACYNRAIALDPRLADAHSNLGLARCAQGDPADAVRHYERAIEIRPGFVHAHYNLAYALLLVGDFERGWREYAWRQKIPGHPSQKIPWPEWEGEPLAGKRLFVYAEQGLGDTIQFLRYLQLVARRADRVTCELPPAIIPLVPALANVELVPAGSQPPCCDAQVSLASLPLVFGTALETIPATVPYLTVEPARVERWRVELAPYKEWKVGIVWQGNPAYAQDRYRSFPLAELAPVAGVPGVRLFSLQKGAGSEQLAACAAAFHIIDLGRRADNDATTLADTGAIMKNLDLVITTDTACAHLAGALGLPVWLATSWSPSWRWLQNRANSPWYPTMRLFRQSSPCRWSDVFERMAQAIGHQTASRPS